MKLRPARVKLQQHRPDGTVLTKPSEDGRRDRKRRRSAAARKARRKNR